MLILKYSLIHAKSSWHGSSRSLKHRARLRRTHVALQVAATQSIRQVSAYCLLNTAVRLSSNAQLHDSLTLI
jgi:hypothetical protein